MTDQHPNLYGIFGGTFDPIHMGHITPLLQAAKQTGISPIALMPCHIPPHKAEPNVSALHRITMLKQVCQRYPEFQLDVRELQRDKPSYTVETLQEMKHEQPERNLAFFMGMDSFLSLPSWHQWRRLFDLCHIIVCHRGGYNASPEFPASLAQICEGRMTDDPNTLYQCAHGKVFIAKTDALAISSTEIRDCLKTGQFPAKLLPVEVLRYIQANQLYLN